MKSPIHDVVRQLLELSSLEDRLAGKLTPREERANVEAAMGALRASLPAGVLVTHDQMRAKGRRSTAEVRRGVCAGCHLALAVGNIAALHRAELRRCGNCGRYVYVRLAEAEPETPAPIPAPASNTRKRKARPVAKPAGEQEKSQ